MGQKGDRTRDSLIQAMIEMLQSRGYSGAGLNDITALAVAPRGSVYFHFPEGKEQLAVAAIDTAAALVEQQLNDACAPARTPAQVISIAAHAFGKVLQQSNFAKGCPLTAVAATIGDETPKLQVACAAGFARWIDALTAHLKRTGLSPRRARTLAETGLASVEGALVMARAMRSLAPLEAALATQISILKGERA
jgi:TetR/AcrR family transcriptional regulator, lmrAB and yxaGH operons repressor